MILKYLKYTNQKHISLSKILKINNSEAYSISKNVVPEHQRPAELIASICPVSIK